MHQYVYIVYISIIFMHYMYTYIICIYPSYTYISNIYIYIYPIHLHIILGFLLYPTGICIYRDTEYLVMFIMNLHKPSINHPLSIHLPSINHHISPFIINHIPSTIRLPLMFICQIPYSHNILHVYPHSPRDSMNKLTIKYPVLYDISTSLTGRPGLRLVARHVRPPPPTRGAAGSLGPQRKAVDESGGVDAALWI